MLKLELELDEIDYDALIERVLALAGERLSDNAVGKLLGSSGSVTMAKAALSFLPQEKRDSFAANLVNDHAEKITAAIQNVAEKNGVPCRVCSVRAKTED